MGARSRRVEGKTQTISGWSGLASSAAQRTLTALDAASLRGEFSTTSPDAVGPYVDQVGRYGAEGQTRLGVQGQRRSRRPSEPIGTARGRRPRAVVWASSAPAAVRDARARAVSRAAVPGRRSRTIRRARDAGAWRGADAGWPARPTRTQRACPGRIAGSCAPRSPARALQRGPMTRLPLGSLWSSCGNALSGMLRLIGRLVAGLMLAALVLAACSGAPANRARRRSGSPRPRFRAWSCWTVAAGRTAMQALEREAEVETRYGGRFVVDQRHRGGASKPSDWF